MTHFECFFSLDGSLSSPLPLTSPPPTHTRFYLALFAHNPQKPLSKFDATNRWRFEWKIQDVEFSETPATPTQMEIPYGELNMLSYLVSNSGYYYKLTVERSQVSLERNKSDVKGKVKDES